MDAPHLDVFDCELEGTTLIEASAGTGKTWNICGLFLRLLLERGLEVRQILVVTFTHAATAELKDRIRERLTEMLAVLQGAGPPGADPFAARLLAALRERAGLRDDEMAARLEAALRNFDEASIFTIHAFCERALADSPFACGLPMKTELLADASGLRLQVVRDFWRTHVAGDRLPAVLGTYLSANDDSPEKWDRQLKHRLGKPLSTLVWPQQVDEADDLDLDALAQAHAAARQTWREQRPDILACVMEARERLAQGSYKEAAVRTALSSWDAQLASADPLAAPKGLDKLDLLTTSRLQPRKGQRPVQPHPFFEQAQGLLEQLDRARQGLKAARLRLLRRLLEQGPHSLRELKRGRRVISFDDMLSNLHEALTGGHQPWLAEALRERFPAALIDEFQDTDPQQFAIFQAIYGGGRSPLFLVGDPKQAIYGFRSADLHTYLQARGQAQAEYTLAANQRSSRELLAALNGLYSRNPQAFVLPGLAYQVVAFGDKPRQAWHDTAAQRAPLQLWELPSDEQGEPLLKARARQAVLEACAGEIARLLDGSARGAVRVGERPLAGGDIAVLVRTHAQGAQVRQALADRGVASVELSQASIFDSPDARELERVLAAVLEPARGRLLRAALATALLGCDAQALEALAADEGATLEIVSRFTAYRETWEQRGVGTMLRALMEGEGVHARLLARADGERRMTNLRHLLEMLHQACEAHPAPELLLRWLREQGAAGAADESAQLRLESDRNLVQVVTIHKCKGLEYPVVFCPFLWDGRASDPPKGLSSREYHDGQGRPVIDFRDELPAAVGEAIRLERDAEQMRLIYVALTRAVHRCYLVVGPYRQRHGRSVSTTESARGPLNFLAAGGGCAPGAWKDNTLDAAAIRRTWASFAQAHPGSVGLEPLPGGPWPRLAQAGAAAQGLAALPAPAQIPSAWWIGSYSGLLQGARHEAAAVDHDGRAELPEAGQAREAAAWPEDDILGFPRGARAGECLHAVFERVDFTDRRTWPAAIASALRDHPQGPLRPGQGEALPRMLAGMLEDVLATPLPGGITLGAVTPARRLVELEFNLPARELRAGSLMALLSRHGYPAPALTFGTLDGYLKGFIDLVFEHEGRFHILDWKSNHLGARPADYAAAQVEQAMGTHGYHLQYLLYTVALHRYLQHRLPGYRYDTHFGGVLYLFVRGVRPGWKDAQGQPTGIHFDRPRQDLVEQLAAWCRPCAAKGEAA
jgi:exodeoxyribonuclease V beta subunit